MAPLVPLVRPTEYFEEHPDPLDIGIGVFACSLVGTVVVFVTLVNVLQGQVQDATPEFVEQVYDELWTPLLLAKAVLILAFLAAGVIMHYGHPRVETDGSLRDALAVAGWAHAPFVLELPIAHLLYRRRASGTTIVDTTPEQVIELAWSIEDPTSLPDVLLAIVVVGWSVIILAAGTAATHDVDVRRTVGPALLVGLGFLVLRFS